MEKILETANEIGLLIKDTGVYKNFYNAKEELASSSEDSRIFDEYLRTADEIKTRQDTGDIIEKFEFENFKELSASASESVLIKNFIAARNEYLDLLSAVQQAISGPDL